MSCALGNMLILDDGSEWGPFTSHWAATAALIRLDDPDFVSLGGDEAIDLQIERDIKERREAVAAYAGANRKAQR